MTALNDAERSDPMPANPTTLGRLSRYFPTLPSRPLTAALIALAGMQLMAMMDGTIAIVALPQLQNELNLSDAGQSWVIIAYVLTYGGLMLLGGRLGDVFGRKRTFVVATVLFTIASAVCGIAWDGNILIAARLVQGATAAASTPTGVALIATTFPKGPVRNAAVALLGVTAAVGAVSSLVVGGALITVSWRLVFLVNVPLGLLVIYLSCTGLRETQKERMKLDATGAVLATLMCTAAIFGFSVGAQKGWLSAPTIGSGAIALGAFVAFVVVERTAENPIVPLDLFFDRSRLALFATIFLAGGVLFALTVVVGLYVQVILGYSGLGVGLAFIPFALAVGLGAAASSRLVARFPPRVVVIAGGTPVVGAMLYGTTLHRGVPYFPNVAVPLVVAAIGIGVITVSLALAVIASVDFDRIGPTSAVAMMLNSLGAPLVLGVIQAVITWRTLSLGGTAGPVKLMTPPQLDALDRGYAYGLLWLAGLSCLIGGVALFIGYTAKQVAQAQEVKQAIDARESQSD
ncbi:MFS transporter [Mycobacterium sp.]|uniref:MFS transporter n=1 Tax=Mycobacterium sp. TaxID=1785 RepID=UPI003D6C2AC5